MQKVVIDGKEYDLEKLPKEAKDLITSIIYVDRELQELENKKRVLTAARVFYTSQLSSILNKEKVNE